MLIIINLATTFMSLNDNTSYLYEAQFCNSFRTEEKLCIYLKLELLDLRFSPQESISTLRQIFKHQGIKLSGFLMKKLTTEFDF